MAIIMKGNVAKEFLDDEEQEDLPVAKKARIAEAIVIPLITANIYQPVYGLNLNTKGNKERAESRGDVSKKPIMAQNSIPGLSEQISDKAKYLHDVAHRPENMSFSEYGRVPIASFGSAMLKGMGWKEGQAIGRNPNGLLAPISLTSRPALLGIGATPLSEIGKVEHEAKVVKAKVVVEGTLEEVVGPRNKIQIGCEVSIINGSHKGKAGKLIDISEKSGGKVAKVSVNGSTARVWFDQIQLRSQAPWLSTNLIVRILSSNLKGTIQDVISLGRCIVKTEKGVLVEVDQEELETVIPSVNESVMVVQGPFAGQTGKIIEIDESVKVQLDDTFEIELFSFNSVSSYLNSLFS